jgi:carboxypeptidase D
MKRLTLSVAALALAAVNIAPAAADTWTTYSEIQTTFAAREASYPTLCKYYDLGTTPGGRHLWAIRISDNVLTEENEPEFRYVSSLHGDEIVGVKMCMNLVDYLLTNYGTIQRCTDIVNNVELWILPLANPDGYDRSPRTRYNNNGADLNRTFPEGGGSSPEPNTTTGRQPEVAAIMNWGFARSFTCSANFHGGALVVNYPFDNAPPIPDGSDAPTPDDDMFEYISVQYSYYNTPMYNGSWYHGITNGCDWYLITGGLQDWSYRYMGCNDVTIELGNTKEPSATQIPTLWTQNRDSMLSYIETCLIGVRGLVTDGVTGAPLAATVTVTGRNHNIYTDPDVGDYHRMLNPGTYTLNFTATGYDPVTVSGVVVASGAATVLNVPMYGPTYVTAPNGGESLTSGVQTNVTWTGNPAAQYHVQYTKNYGATGVITDGFERTALGTDYATGGNLPWVTSTSSFHTGARSAKAGPITDSQTTWMTRSAMGGTLTFWHRVRSEPGADYFNFYVDGVQKIHRAGNWGWTQYTTTLTTGTHLLKWEYVKDASVAGFDDTAWIDDLQLNGDATTWTDIIALTPVGSLSTPWTPVDLGSAYKVRIRPYAGGAYGAFDESNATFTVVAPPCQPADLDGDIDGDGLSDGRDIKAFVSAVMSTPTPSQVCHGDFNDNDALDIGDITGLISALLNP